MLAVFYQFTFIASRNKNLIFLNITIFNLTAFALYFPKHSGISKLHSLYSNIVLISLHSA